MNIDRKDGCFENAEPPKGRTAPTAEPTMPLADLDQLVTAERLREIIWDEQSRPSLQWIRKETKRRMLPHIRRGRRIFYRPRSVLEWYGQRETRPARWGAAVLTILDEYTRECHVLWVDRALKAADVLHWLQAAIAKHGAAGVSAE